MPIKTVSMNVDAANAGRVDLIVRELSQLSRSQIRGLVDHGCVSINGRVSNNIAATAKEGDVVAVRYDPNQRYREKKRTWDDRTFSIVFEDEHLIVVDKAAGTLTVPTDNGEPNTLIDRVSIYLSHSKSKREACLVHRLDREVSGVLVFGKHEAIANLLIDQFRDRKPDRVYNAIVAGVMASDEGTFQSHLVTAKNLDVYQTAPGKNTEEAITHYKVLKRMEDTTLVEARLETGKRNQIRVHFSAAGHPVLGDPRYRKDDATHVRWTRKRIALHALSLGLIHPVSGEPMMFETELPAAMSKFLRTGTREDSPIRKDI